MPASSVYQLIRGLFVKPSSATPEYMHGKTVIVTGASVGSIGFDTARILASWGARVVITTRSHTDKVVKMLRIVSGSQPQIDGHPLDLTSADSVAAFAEWFKKEQFEKTHDGRLDVLINNAGVHLDLLSQWKEPQLSADGFEIHWRTNYLGTMHLTHLLLPLLQATGRKTGDARILNVVSKLHSKGFNAGLFDSYPYNSWAAYGMSKLALVHATFELQRRFAAADHVQAYCLHPGSVFSNIADKGLNGNSWLQVPRNALAPVERFFLLTTEEGAQTSIHCASSPDAAGGQYYQRCRPRLSSPDSRDAAVAARLWEKTCTWVQSLAH